MTIKTARSALRIPYLAVRTPLGLLDEQVVVRVFGVDSTAHRSLVRGLHTLDSLAASAFTPTTGAHPQTAAGHPTDEPDAAPEPEPQPEPADDIITDVEPVDRDGGDQPLEAEEQDEIEQLTDTLLDQAELAPRSGELAENDELRRVQAEIRAKQEIESEHGQI